MDLTIRGPHSPLTISVDANSYGAELRLSVAEQMGVEAKALHLTHGIRVVSMEKTLLENGMTKLSEVYACVSLDNGKKKKKVLETPKKLRHRNKKVKLAILK
eukprot:GHVP01063936.1.p1 GENE.GHVP01063936.1~~GHVP01063936.1.p1  ORF type:complete len:102 (-),score=21.76 GHVP01063936.1:41-346(-)